MIIAGVVIFIAGLAKSGSIKLSNFGINIGSTSTQTIIASPGHEGEKPKRDWIGLAIAALGLLTVLVGLLKKD